jgi:polyisoprenoid-binding protein YceI
MPVSLRFAIAAAFALAAAPALAAPTTYTLDAGHTQVVFQWSHFGFSNPTAQFGKVIGTLEFDPAAPEKSRLEVTIPLSSVNTNVPALDEHLQKADFFDSAKYPDATFKSTKVERGAGKDQLKVTGDLTLHGQTHPLVLDVTINKIGQYPMKNVPAAGFDATTTIKRSQFGIDQYVPNISDDIKVRITTEAIAEEPAKAPANEG